MQNEDALAARFGPEEAPDDPHSYPVEVEIAPSYSRNLSVAAASAEGTTAELAPVAPPLPELAPEHGFSVPGSVEGGPHIAPPILLAAIERDIPFSGAQALSSSRRSQECEPALSVAARPGALAELDISAPCHAGAAARVHHQGLIFSVILDGDGHAFALVPAIASPAVFIAEFSDGTEALGVADLPDLALYERAVLQWRGVSGLSIHAFEPGEEEEREVSALSGGDLTASLNGEGGFLTVLGDARAPEAHFAEIYSFPSGAIGDKGVRLVVEAEILAQTCGRDIAAQTIQIKPGTKALALDLTMTLPDCEAVGEYLVLSNLLEDLTLAAR